MCIGNLAQIKEEEVLESLEVSAHMRPITCYELNVVLGRLKT